MVVGALAWIVASTFSQQASPRSPAPDEAGGETVVLETIDLAGSSGFARLLGRSAATLGDLDGDGSPELLVGSGQYTTDRAVLFFEDAAGSGRPRHRIGNRLGGFEGTGAKGFGAALAVLDDLDGDGIPEVAVGAPDSDDGAPAAGAVWILYLDRNGEVRHEHEISALEGGFGGVLDADDHFGVSLAVLDDLDGDGRRELAVGADDDDGGTDQGAIWILFLDADGRVQTQQKISATTGGFGGDLDTLDQFGSSVAALGDLDGDGVCELAVGAPGDDDLLDRGAVWILFLNADGTVRVHQKISATAGGLPWPLARFDDFGSALCTLGDVDGDGIGDLVAGVPGAFADDGLVLHVFLNADGTVRGVQPVGEGLGGLVGPLDGRFGSSLAPLGDLDLDGHQDLLVGASAVNSGAGEFWILELDAGGVVLTERSVGGVEPPHGGGDAFVPVGDLGGDGTIEVALGRTDVQASIQLLSLDASGAVVAWRTVPMLVYSDTEFGIALASLDDLDGDGLPELAMGVPGRKVQFPSNAPRKGAFRILFLNPDGTHHGDVETNEASNAVEAFLDDRDRFGAALAPIGDFDGDGVADLAVGAPGDDDGGDGAGAVYLAFLRSDGTVREVRKIGAGAGGMGSALAAGDAFGSALATLPDLDGNGVLDLAIGAPLADLPYAPDAGVVWLVNLAADGSVLAHTSITSHRRGFPATLWGGERFGSALATLGDVDGNGATDLAVGAPGDDDGVEDAGAVWLLHMRANGRVRRAFEIGAEHGGFDRLLFRADGFGGALGALGDVNGDGVPDLGVGAPGSDWLAFERGFAWTLLL